MRRWLYWLAVAAVTALLLCACADSGDNESTDDQEGTKEAAAPTKQARSGAEEETIWLLEQYLDAHRSAGSFRGRIDIEMKTTGVAGSLTAEYAFRRPNEMHMVVQTESVSSELVVAGGRNFQRVGGGGWEELSSEIVSASDVASMMAVPHTAQLDPGLYENLSVEEGDIINDVETVHISFDINVEEAMGEASGILVHGFSGLTRMTLEWFDLSGSHPMDVWIGKDDKLARRIDFHGKAADEDLEMKMTMEFFDYGEPVEIPSLEEMLERTGG